MRDPNKARLKKAMQALRDLFPESKSREVAIRDDGILILTVDGEVVAYWPPQPVTIGPVGQNGG